MRRPQLRSATRAVAPVTALAMSCVLAGCGGSSSPGSSNASASSGGGGSSSSSAAAGGSTAASGGAAASGGGSVSGTMTVYADGDVNVKNLWQKTLIPGFTKANPGAHVNLIFSEHGANNATTLAKLGASVKIHANPGLDLIDSGLVESAAQAQFLEKVSPSNIPNLSMVSPGLLQPVSGRAVPYRASMVVLAYNSDKVSNPPKTLNDLLSWIKAHPGKFTYNSPSTGGSGQAFVEAVLDKYMPASDVKQMATTYMPNKESEWSQGFQTLKSLNSDIYQHVYPNGNQNVLDLLAKGQIDIAPVWSDQSLAAKQSGVLGPNIKFEQISGFYGSAAYLGIPVNSKNQAIAQHFANWILKPANQKTVVQAMSGYPGIELKYMPQDIQQQFAGINTSQLQPGYETKTANDMNNQWQEKVPG